MTAVRHLNCGFLHVPPNPRVGCHCLLLQDGDRLALVDTGIGLRDVQSPVERVGRDAMDAAGFQFREDDTAIRQLERLGLPTATVTDIVLTHADPDHTGGLADWPNARIHLSAEELAAVRGGHWRYRPPQFEHGPDWRPLAGRDRDWFGLPARVVPLGFNADVLLVPLFGHTAGHCGVAVRQGERWLLHVGDAYYLRAELASDDHPVSALAAARADDDARRRESLAHLRRLATEHADEIEMFGYHDLSEWPESQPPAVPS